MERAVLLSANGVLAAQVPAKSPGARSVSPGSLRLEKLTTRCTPPARWWQAPTAPRRTWAWSGPRRPPGWRSAVSVTSVGDYSDDVHAGCPPHWHVRRPPPRHGPTPASGNRLCSVRRTVPASGGWR